MDDVRARLALDPTSPSGLTHKVTSGRGVAGQPAGVPLVGGYWRVFVKGKQYQAHRLVWELTFGPIPEGHEIDHKDCDPSNNNVSNLRLACRQSNNQNRRVHSNSATGVKGLSWVSRTQRWLATVESNKVRHSITTPDREYAEAWLIVKRAELHGDFANNGARPHEGE